MVRPPRRPAASSYTVDYARHSRALDPGDGAARLRGQKVHGLSRSTQTRRGCGSIINTEMSVQQLGTNQALAFRRSSALRQPRASLKAELTRSWRLELHSKPRASNSSARQTMIPVFGHGSANQIDATAQIRWVGKARRSKPAKRCRVGQFETPASSPGGRARRRGRSS